MSNSIKVQKTIYGLQSFTSNVNTKFSQLIREPKPTVVVNDKTISEFFNDYDNLFYEIPPTGSAESHLILATRSLEYCGLSLDDLRNEIDFLREENINLKNQILTISQIQTGSLEE